ncbi:MAG TPA: GDP-mannose 4,6-dehydratase [Acidobacteriota bacterium]|nr:GDP-mannose 4,6-dehydratase [Acidobacteriota bacterium]
MSSGVLVTGGAGFIGSHLVDRLLADGESVTVLDNFNDFYDPAVKRTNMAAHLDYGHYTLVEGDIRDRELVNATFRAGGFRQVIHLAAMAGVQPSIQNPSLYQEVNLTGTANILEACRTYDVSHLIFASSSSVYGNNEKVPFSESDPVDRPISPYAATKRAGELMTFTYHHLYGIKTACLRLFTVYGPRQRPEMAIHLFTDRIYRGEEITVFGDGRSSRDYTYVDDIIAGILAGRTAEYDFQIINLGCSQTVSLAELVEKIEHYLGKKAKIVHRPDRPGDVRRTFADTARARELLGFRATTPIDTGLKLFTQWYCEKRGRQ